jgi:hypothetical protein
MSEYQYYEFLAIDRPLTAAQMDEVREFSSRAEVTPTSFVNEYNYGSFRGDPEKFIERYFDAMMYYANWGTRTLLLGLPRDAIDPDVLDLYCAGEEMWSKVRGDRLILGWELMPDDGPDDDVYDLGTTLAVLSRVREELFRGDYRALYIGWLRCAQNHTLAAGPDDAPEPPVPSGLASLSPAQRELADFIAVADDLIEAAARASEPLAAATDDVAARKAEANRTRAQAEAARKRAADLEATAARGDQANWAQVERLIGERNKPSYDAAADLLADLRELAVRSAALDAFSTRVRDLCTRHARKPTLIERIRERKLV